MKKTYFLLLLLSSISLFSQTNCSDFKLSDFKINGSTTVTTNEATLTRAIGSQGGSIWSNQKIDLSKDFKISSELNFGTIDGGGADGIAFVLQPLSSDLGSSGGGLGYQGISPSIAVEFDTWFNGGIDPVSQDHIAIIKNGRTDNMSAHSEFNPPIILPNIEDGLWHEAVFEWDSNTKKLKLTFDNIVRFDVTIDIANSVFSSNNIVHWGFTAATGAAVNIQKVKLKNYCVTLETCSNIPEIIASKISICSGETTQLSINSQTNNTAIFSATQTFSAPWNINWPVTVGKNYVLKVSGTYGITSSSGIDVDAAYNLINTQRYNQTCSGYQDRWKLIDNCPARPSPDTYNSQHIYYYNIMNSDGSVDINYSDSLYNDNSGSLNFELYNYVSYIWSTGETTSAISPSPLETTTYWVDVTTNGITCRKSILITVKSTPAPTGVVKQHFCNDTSINALVVNGTAIKWYASATGTSPLSSNYALANETNYFATQTIDGCESINRFQTTVTIQKVSTPNGESIQRFCLEDTPNITKLNVIGTNINWMDSPTNGSLLNNTTLLQDNTTYYAKSIDTTTGCESIQRLAVNVDLFRCNIIAFNLVSTNGDPLNDKLSFEEISYFPDNSVKIYNRYGKLVWETTGYNNTTNAFKGKANVSVYMNDSFLPAGTYYYILVYNNTYREKESELTGYLQIE
jgi:gliding motility-associated-like protein